jgi:hypothetical protein
VGARGYVSPTKTRTRAGVHSDDYRGYTKKTKTRLLVHHNLRSEMKAKGEERPTHPTLCVCVTSNVPTYSSHLQSLFSFVLFSFLPSKRQFVASSSNRPPVRRINKRDVICLQGSFQEGWAGGWKKIPLRLGTGFGWVRYLGTFLSSYCIVSTLPYLICTSPALGCVFLFFSCSPLLSVIHVHVSLSLPLLQAGQSKWIEA